MQGQIFKIQKYSIHDGPGIRTTVFFQGCPLSCMWCHNPESRPVFSENKISEIREVNPDVLAAEMEKDSIFFDQSNGGVTCSGGEPLFQHEFLIDFLKQLKEREIHAAVDTSGFAPVHVMSETANIADLILFDLKLIENEDHIKYTGVPVKQIHENLKMLHEKFHEKNVKIWLRFPLIPKITEKDKNIDKLIDFLLLFKKFRHINILPFHKTGEGKYLKLGIKDPMKGTEPLSEERIEDVKKKFEKKGFSVTTGG